MNAKLAVLIISVFSAINSVSQPTSEIPLTSPHFTIEKLAEGVFAAIHNDDGGLAICNAGIIDIGDKTIVLDPFISPVAARDLKNQAELLTGKQVSFVVNMDLHNDHTNGNQVFVPDADIISTPNTRRYIQDHFNEEFEYFNKNGSNQLSKISQLISMASGDEKTELIMNQLLYRAMTESLPELKMTLPDITIKDTTVIYGSKRRIILIPTGIGHTDGDIVAWLPEDKIIFMSDQLFVKRHPYLGDGNPDSLVANLKKIISLEPVIAIPGHGPVGDLNSIYQMIEYVETLKKLVGNEIGKGTDENTIMELPVPAEFKEWLLSSYYKINLKFLYRMMAGTI
jgi:cyclase